MDRFAPPLPGGRRPIYRYLSKTLLKSIRFDELHRLRDRYPAVLNGLPTDSLYAETEGSEPADQTSEVLQTWETITSFGSPESLLQPHDCIPWIQSAEAMYRQIALVPGLALNGRSGEAHLDSLRDGVRIFAELAELEIR